MKNVKQFKIRRTHFLFAVSAAFGIALAIGSCDNHKESAINLVSGTDLAEQENAKSYASLGAIDDGLVEHGKAIFTDKCARCHTLDKKIKGPALRGVTKRHPEKWVMGLLANLQKLSQADSVVKHVMEINNDEYVEPNKKSTTIPLTTPEERRALIEFLRKES